MGILSQQSVEHDVMQRHCGLTVEVVVPDSHKSQDDGQVVLQLSLLEMPIHLVSTQQELLKVLVSDGKSDGETNGGPERVSASYPVPELEHVGRRDTERGDGFGVGAKGDEVLGNVFLLQAGSSI